VSSFSSQDPTVRAKSSLPGKSNHPPSSDIDRGDSKWQYVPDGVTGTETNPLRNRAVLLLRLGELLLRAESLVALY